MYFLSEDKTGGRKEDLDAEMITGPRKDGGKDWDDKSQGKSQQGLKQPPEARRESWNDISPIALRRTHPCRNLYFILLAF